MRRALPLRIGLFAGAVAACLAVPVGLLAFLWVVSRERPAYGDVETRRVNASALVRWVQLALCLGVLPMARRMRRG